MARESQIRAQAKYDKNNTKQVMLKLNINSDADILAKLSNEKTKQGYIKELVRNDMRNIVDILTLDSIKFLLLPIVKKYGIKSLSVFGSYARNEATPTSDVDILIDGGNYHGLVEYMTMIDDMKAVLGRDVDVITQNALNEGKTKADKIFRDNVEKERLVLI